jgi:DNA-binding MarR family transcriptional regulator
LVTPWPRLPALLSQALVAYTVEFDNEFEHRMPHRTTIGGHVVGGGQDPWLVSMAMWLNCMRFVGDTWMPVHELQRQARTGTNLAGMQRWGYVHLERDPDDPRANPPSSDLLILRTTRGRMAQEVWSQLDGVVEQRWQERFGITAMATLRASLRALASRLDAALPDCLPILRYGLWTRVSQHPQTSPAVAAVAELSLPALLARALVALAVEFESESDVSLAIAADVLRVLDAHNARLRDLPCSAGVSKEAISMALGVLEKQRLAVVEPDPAASRGKVVRLTDAGRTALRASRDLLEAIDERWALRFGAATIGEVRASLEPLVGDGSATSSPLFAGLTPHPDGWRGSVPAPERLPYFPMVLHRGGYPDGS